MSLARKGAPSLPAPDGFPARLRQAREDKRLTLAALGEKCGISAQVLSLYELGRRDPERGTVETIAAALGVSAAWLAYGADV